MHLTVLLTVIICGFSQIFSSPVPSEDPKCLCKWTQWINVDHPNQDPNGGDWETLANITTHGFDVCPAPKDIQCRSVRFPYVPFSLLQYNMVCDRSRGLICLNENNELGCIDFEVQFLCCPCNTTAEMPKPTPQITTVPSEDPKCLCKWTQWINVDHPNQDPNGGDWETLANITTRGFDVCPAPKDIQCRSVRFPYVPFSVLKYNMVCDRSRGLICLNENNELGCIDFEVQFLCCPCNTTAEMPKPTPQITTVPSEDPKCLCKWTQWINVDHPNQDPNGGDWETLANITTRGFDVCPAPKDIQCRSVRFPYVPFSLLQYNMVCDRSRGLICLNENNELGCIDFEVQFLCCPCNTTAEIPKPTPQITTETPTMCPNAQCTWSDWFNTHRPTPGPDGGDFENVTAVIKQGHPICTDPQAAECRLVRVPYVPLDQLLSTQECSADHGLVCSNKNQNGQDCLDYEARFLCCTCDVADKGTLEDMTDQASGMCTD